MTNDKIASNYTFKILIYNLLSELIYVESYSEDYRKQKKQN